MAFEMTDDEFERLAERALDEIPADLLALMDNVVIFIEDSYTPMPGEAPDTKLLGLYEGTSLTERDGGWDAGALPDRITIYKNAILEICSSEKQVVEEVGITVVHEIAHHFGIDDQAPPRARLGLKPIKFQKNLCDPHPTGRIFGYFQMRP